MEAACRACLKGVAQSHRSCSCIFILHEFLAHADGESRGLGLGLEGGVGNVSVRRHFRCLRPIQVLGVRRRRAPRYYKHEGVAQSSSLTQPFAARAAARARTRGRSGAPV